MLIVTVGDSAFPKYVGLLKIYIENTRDKQQKYFNKKLCEPRVVTERMLKGIWHSLCERTECRLFTLPFHLY